MSKICVCGHSENHHQPEDDSDYMLPCVECMCDNYEAEDEWHSDEYDDSNDDAAQWLRSIGQ